MRSDLGKRHTGETLKYAGKMGSSERLVRRLGGVEKLKKLAPEIQRLLLKVRKTK